MGTVNIHATVSSLIAPGTNSPLQLSSPAAIRNLLGQRVLGQQLSQCLSTDLDNIRTQINTINTAAQKAPTVSQLLITNAAGQVVAGVGNLTYNGVQYTNFFSELHVGNSLLTRNPAEALFNANTDGSVSIGQNGWLDVHDPWAGNAAWIGTQYDSLPITGASDNGAGAIRLKVDNHTLATGNTPQVRNMQFAGVPNATGQWTVTVIDGNTIDLQGSVWAGTFVLPKPPGGINTAAPVIDRILQVAGCIQTPAGTTIRLLFDVATGYESGTAVTVANVGGIPNATGQWITSIPATLAVTGAVDNGSGLIRLTVLGQNFVTGDKPEVIGVGGVTNANGFWTVTVVDASHIDLQNSHFMGVYTSGGTISFLSSNVVDLAENAVTDAPSVFAGTYAAGGTCLQYFAGVLAETIAIGQSFQNYKLRAFPDGTLRIKNANIELTSSVGQIILNPNTTQITLTNFANLSAITIDATVPSLTLQDQTGTPQVALEILQAPEGPLASTYTTSSGNPVVMTNSGPGLPAPYLNGDTILVMTAPSTQNINGYRIVENVSTGAGTFTMTDLFGSVIRGTAAGPDTGTATSARYYAGLLAQSLALGASWPGYRLRFFADGTLALNNATIDSSTITNSTVDITTFTSVGGTPPNTITLTINNGILTIIGAGTQTGLGTITIDGLMTAGSYATAAGAGVDGPITIFGLVVNFSQGIYTGNTGSLPVGLSLTATVRNAAGSGTSALVFTDGILTTYTP